MCVCVCVRVCVALVIQHTKRMRRLKLSSVASLARPCFYTLSHKVHNILEQLLKIRCVFCFFCNILYNITHSNKNSETSIVNVQSLHVKYPLHIADSNKNLNIFNRFWKNSKISNFTKICSLVTEFDGQRRTNMTNQIIAFRNFANAHEMSDFIIYTRYLL
jgi:hypothetical protein